MPSALCVYLAGLPCLLCSGDKELLLNPIKICRNDRERCLIEPSINSLRFSVKIKQMDELDMVLTGKFTRFLMMRAENFVVLQRKPAKDYDISFLITNEHLDSMWKHKVIDFLIQFMEDVDAQVRASWLAGWLAGCPAFCSRTGNVVACDRAYVCYGRVCVNR